MIMLETVVALHTHTHTSNSLEKKLSIKINKMMWIKEHLVD